MGDTELLPILEEQQDPSLLEVQTETTAPIDLPEPIETDSTTAEDDYITLDDQLQRLSGSSEYQTLDEKINTIKQKIGLVPKIPEDEPMYDKPIGPKPSEDSVMFKADAFRALDTSESYSDGIMKLTESYDKSEWSNPEEAQKTLEEYGNKLRQKFKIDSLNPEDTYTLSPINIEDIDSDKIDPYEATIDRLKTWKAQNLEALQNSKDPRILANKELLKRSIENTSVYSEGFARGAERNEDMLNPAWIKDKALRFARSSVDPLYSLVTGEKFKYLDRFIDPERDTSISGEVSSLAGTITGYTVPAIPLLAAGVSATPAFILGSIPAAAGYVRERYNFAKDISGSPELAEESAAIEGAAQAIGVLPFGFLGGAAYKGLKTIIGAKLAQQAAEAGTAKLAGEALKEVIIPNFGKSIVKEGTKGALTGGIVNTIQEYGTNISMQQALENNDIDLTANLDKSFVYGSLFGGVLGSLDAGKSYTKDVASAIDLALKTKEAQGKGIKNDINNFTGKTKPVNEAPGVNLENLKPLREQNLKKVYPTIEENVFNTKEDTSQTVVKSSDGNTDIIEHSPAPIVPKEIIEADMGVDYIDTKPIEPSYESVTEMSIDDIANNDKNLNNAENISDQRPQSRNLKAVFISRFPGGTYSDIGLSPGGLQIAMHIAENFVNKSAGNFIRLLKSGIRIGGYMQPMQKIEKSFVAVPKDLFANTAYATQVIAHELGHFVDYMNNFFDDVSSKDYTDVVKYKPLVNRLKGIKDSIASNISSSNDAILENQARNVSRRWRHGWDGSTSQSYRISPEEVYADTFGALLLKPDLVKEYPELYRALDEGLSESPEVGGLWNWWKNNEDNPRVLEDAYNARQYETVKRTYEIENRRADEEYKKNNPSLYAQGKKIIDKLRATFISKYYHILKNIKNLDGKAKETAYELVNILQTNTYLGSWLDKHMADPMKRLMNYVEMQLPLVKVKDSRGNLVPLSMKEFLIDYKNLIENKGIIEITSPGIERIKQNPAPYFEFASKYIVEPGEGSVSNMLSDQYKDFINQAIASNDVGLFIDTLARLDNEIGSGDIPTKYLPVELREAVERIENNPELNPNQKKAERDKLTFQYYRSLDNQENPNKKRASNIFNIIKSSVDEKVFEDITNANTFKIPKYIGQSLAKNIFDANQAIKNLKDKYGQNYSLLEKFDKDFHNIIAAPADILKQSGLYSDELLTKFALNKDSYYTRQVVDYFQGYGEIDPLIRKATGSIKENVDPIGATLSKMYAMAAHAQDQITKNAFIELAYLTGYDVTQLVPKKGESVFKVRDKFNKESDTDFAVVGYSNGKPTLYKIKNGKEMSPAIQASNTSGIIPAVGNFLKTITDAMLIRDIRTRFNPAFAIAQKPLDRFNEAVKLTVKSKDLGGLLAPWNIIKTVYDLNYGENGSSRLIKQLSETGTTTDRLLNMAIDYNVFGGGIEDYGVKPKDSLRAILDSLAVQYEVEQTPRATYVDRMHQKGYELLQKNILTRNAANLLEYVSGMTERDEARTKFNGFKLGMQLGMSPAEAAHWARSSFGIPDPTGGGTAAGQINNYFLFGRAYINGLRDAYNTITQNGTRGYVAGTLGIILPRLLMAGGASTLIGALYGEEAGEVYKRYLEKVPSFDKISKIMLPVGFIDTQGNLRPFGTFKYNEIGVDWKAASFGLPQPYVLADMSRILWPMVDGVMQTAVTGELEYAKRGISKGKEGVLNLGTSFAGRTTPAIQWMFNTAMFALGENPYDLYRGKPIIPKDIQAGGSFIERGSIFAKYMANQIAPNVVGFNPYTTSESPKTLYDQMNAVPLAGPLTRSFFRVSNYGEIEKAAQVKEDRNNDLSALKISLDDASTEMFTRYRKVIASRNAYGKDYKTIRNAQEVKEVKEVLKWHRKFQEFRSEIENAENKGDSEATRMWRNNFEKFSRESLSYILSE